MAHIYNGILLSHKKEWNNANCSNMDGPRDCHTEWSKLDRERQSYHLYAESKKKKKDTNELVYKTETNSQTQKTNLWLQKGKGGGRDKLGAWDWHILYLKWITNKDLLFSTGNSTQYYVIT